MGFLDWLFGAPTMDKLVRDVTRALRRRDAQDLRVDLEQAIATATVRHSGLLARLDEERDAVR